MSKDLILAIDAGTQAVRALLFDARGEAVAKARLPIEPYVSSAPGLAEQNPSVYWEALCQACQQLWAQGATLRDRLAGVALTTQRSTVINVDKDGNPLRPAIVWLDQRRTAKFKPVGGLWGLVFRLSGMTSTVSYLQAEAEANWISTYQPQVWKDTHKYLFLSGYLTQRLVGEFVDSMGCQVGYIPFDYKRQRWSKPWDWKWQAVPIDPHLLVDLVPQGDQLGEITPTAASVTGIPAGLPLIATAADKACEVIGAGCLEPSLACLSYGTTATINTTHKRYLEIIPLIPPYPAAIPGAYSLELQIYRGFWMVSWFKQEFGLREQQMAKAIGAEAEALFDELVASAPPGAHGLILQPYWSPGLRFPGPEARGAIIGFGDVHTRAHLYRAILEGLGFALREGAERTARRSGIPIKALRVVGGGSQSDAAMQITADIFGLPASRSHLYEASALGAALVASVPLGFHPDYPAAVAAMTRPGQLFEPNPAHQALYHELYHRVYKKIYTRLQGLYAEIRAITAE
ncbi:MAG: FGGY-family carbohydrate kinase [Anaerolineales bacterium]|nr:FGGY-family carbohydrate kinase [Anaerolineales bacterium]